MRDAVFFSIVSFLSVTIGIVTFDLIDDGILEGKSYEYVAATLCFEIAMLFSYYCFRLIRNYSKKEHQH